MKDVFNVNEACKAQAKLQKEKGYPDFAPSNGRCYNCRSNIYEPIERKQGGRTYTTGITVEKAASQLVTGCPHCHRSYCD